MTLKEKIIQQIETFKEAIFGEEVRDAYVEIAKTVCIEAMEKVDHVVEQGNYAESQGDYAKEQGTYAEEQGAYAGEQGDYAKEQGTFAKTKGDRVDNLCRKYIEVEQECIQATNASREQTELCTDATQRAIEAATGYSMIYDPVDGERKTTQEVINNLWKQMAMMFGSPITQEEYDAFGLTQEEYDALHITQFEYDTRAKAILSGRNGGE